MSFATLEEAWGVPTLGHAESGFAVGGMQGPVAPLPPKRQQRPAHRRRQQRRRRPPPHVGLGSNARGRADFAPAPELMPSSGEDDVQIQNTRRFLAQTYARFGTPGVLRLLPPPALGELSAAVGGGGGALGRRGGGHGGFFGDLKKFFASPEKVLFLLLCAFALLVVWDNWHSSQAAAAAATMASMQLTAFPA